MSTKFSINTKTGSFSANQCNVLTKLKPTTFTNNFTKIITKSPLNVSYLIVGGGAGGQYNGAGNGGTVVYGNYNISTDIDIIIGSGGAGEIYYSNDPNIPPTDGNPSYIKYFNSSTILLSATGGIVNSIGNGGYGGNDINPPTVNVNDQPNRYSNGGNGIISTITGISEYYAGGGGNYYYYFPPPNFQYNQVYGTNGLGSYGLGGQYNVSGAVSGNSGAVIISYKYPGRLATGGTVTSYLSGSDTWWVHTFTSSGKLIL